MTAWSEEALQRTGESASEREILKWSYADSPYYLFGDEFFDEVRTLYARLPAINGDTPLNEWDREFAFRLQAMEAAMAQLDAEELFGSGEARLAIVVAVEVMPPDESNARRIQRLNPPGAAEAYLQEAAGS